MKLHQRECTACGPSSEPVADPKRLLEELPGWQIVQEEGTQQLKRSFEFEDFEQALAFTNKVGALAEQVNHHPALVTEWGRATVRWWTHTIGGLHLNDFILAARTSELLES